MTPPCLSVPPMPMDVRAHEFKTIEDLVSSGHEVTLSVAIVVVTGAYPTDLYTRVLTCLARAVRVDSTQQLRAARLLQYPVMLHPIDPETKARDPGQPAYTCRFLNRCSSADFEAALESFVATIVAQHPALFPSGPSMWGEYHRSAPLPHVPVTQVDFEDAIKAFLVLVSQGGRLHEHVASHVAAKQLVDERALKKANEDAALALAAAKAQDEEKVRLAKATPDFPEHMIVTYVAQLEGTTGHLVLNPFLNNARVCTRFYDALRTNNLPSSPALAPDQCKPYANALTGQVLFYKTSAKLAQASDGGQSTTAVAYEFEEELVEGGATPVRQRVCSLPTTIDQAFANVQRWFMTILVAAQALLPGATFRLSPQAALAYLQTLHYVSTYQGMTLDRFLMYRNESLREIIQAYNKDGAGGSLDPVLKVAIGTLNNDLVNFRKLFAGLASVDKVTPTPSSCAGCDKSKKQYDEAKSEIVNKAKRIAVLEEQIAKLKARLSGDGAGYRSGSHRGGSNRGGFSRGGGRDYDRDRDRDRDHDQDRSRDSLSRKRPEPGSNGSKNS